MAPVKRTTAATQRETRSTRSTAVAKKIASAAEKKAVSPVGKTTVTSKPAAATRRTKKSATEPVEEQDEDRSEPPTIAETTTTRTRTTKPAVTRKATASTTVGAAAAARRRIKVTPLDTTKDIQTSDEAEIAPAKMKTANTTTKSTTKRKATEVAEPEKHEEKVAGSKTRSTRKTTSTKESALKTKATTTAAKTRAKPKKTDDTPDPEDNVQEDVTAPVARMTRARAGSTATQQSDIMETTVQARTNKANAGVRKKVTFQDLPEDDKENQPLPLSKARKGAVAKESTKSVSKATGIKAKPVRSTTASATARGRKVGTSITNRSATKDQAKNMPTVLTPKKVPQVAKGKLPEDEHDDFSDGEDELNGGKTPVRDLSMSPKRPPTSAMAKAMSPVKKLSFEQNLGPAIGNTSTSGFGSNVLGQSTILASPARRMPASPFKDGLMNSPRRGLGESTRLLFSAQGDGQQESGASIAFNSANLNTASQNMNNLLKSPKRNGNLDSEFFSQSAIKQSVSASPFKTSLLASPAKRLFSPKKKVSEIAKSQISEFDMDLDDEDAFESPAQEIVATSHFRASESPVRVHRVDLDAPMIDFDESVLPIGSPLKIAKGVTPKQKVSPQALPEAEDQSELQSSIDVPEGQVNKDASSIVTEVPSVNPAQLEKASEIDQGLNGIGSTTTSPQASLETGLELPTPAVAVEQTEEPIATTDAAEVESTANSPLEGTSELPVGQALPREEEDASSEDELAVDETPLRPLLKSRSSLVNQNMLSRQSFGIPSSAAGKGYGFTPLAAQISGWRATSPQKTPKPRASRLQRVGSFEFSPAASEHIEGEVVISRGSTPVQMMKKQDLSDSIGKQSRKSLNLSKSPGPHRTFQDESGEVEADAEENAQFDELMAAQNLADEAASIAEELGDLETDNGHKDFEHIMSVDETEDEDLEQTGDDTVLQESQSENDATEDQSTEQLPLFLKYTHASDSAMIDFKKLAEEAEDLASAVSMSETGNHQETEDEVPSPRHEEVITEVDSDEVYGDENQDPIMSHREVSIAPRADEVAVNQSPIPETVSSPVLQPTIIGTVSPSLLVIGDVDSSPVIAKHDIEVSTAQVSTPVGQNTQLARTRLVNTVVSKVPLRPEGHVSPIKMPRKRARSFGTDNELPAKRLSLSAWKQAQIPSTEMEQSSPDRTSRTSTAPSPGGTSTPASRYSRLSLGAQSIATTPGQMSFAVDDFGDSTLDGIELPDDITQMTIGLGNFDNATPALSEKTFGLASLMATPTAAPQNTPATTQRGARRVTAPAVAIGTPKTVQKTPQRNSLDTAKERTPLRAVGKGVLDGAVVFVDVHTSEGADASGIFVELLVQMGAKCVKEWRWNPRASLAVSSEGQNVETNVGITHVVYKDGGKRTLEKVRDARGEVCCVGVSWVLDCERESKWLDEATYAVDTSLLPRGGSRRRKSMEPRALLHNGTGSVSTGKPRRSVSAEMSEMMKRELVNTPVRGREIHQDNLHDDRADDEEDDEENVPAATPTGYIAYDPRTAMTPGTPYLANQNKNLVQKSAPPKQTGKRLFEDDQDENDGQDNLFMDEGARGLDADKSVSDAKKFRMKNLDMKSRRRTLGFKPIVGSPLSRT